jgi:hypothetical protein
LSLRGEMCLLVICGFMFVGVIVSRRIGSDKVCYHFARGFGPGFLDRFPRGIASFVHLSLIRGI